MLQWLVEQDSFTEVKTNIKKFKERSLTKIVKNYYFAQFERTTLKYPILEFCVQHYGFWDT